MLELPAADDLMPIWPVTIDGVTHCGWWEIARDPKPREGRNFCSCTGDLTPGRTGPWGYMDPFYWHVAALWHEVHAREGA